MLRESVYREEYQPGAAVFREGEPGNRAYVIERGMVQLETLRRGRKITIANLGEGELFGEMALIDGDVRTSTALATEETVLVVISLNGGWTADPDRNKPGRELGYTRYDKMAEGLGCYAEYVEAPEDIRPALERAQAQVDEGRVAVVNVKTDFTARAGTQAFAQYST